MIWDEQLLVSRGALQLSYCLDQEIRHYTLLLSTGKPE